MTAAFEIIADSADRLTLKREGQDDVADIRLRRSFPWSDAGHFVSVRSHDGKELLLIDDVATLAAEQGELVHRWLGAHSFIPKILRVHDIDMRYGYQLWSTETDRGPASFRVQEREDVRFLSAGRFSVKDADGNIYEISNVQTLDEKSQRMLEVLV